MYRSSILENINSAAAATKKISASSLGYIHILITSSYTNMSSLTSISALTSSGCLRRRTCITRPFGKCVVLNKFMFGRFRMQRFQKGCHQGRFVLVVQRYVTICNCPGKCGILDMCVWVGEGGFSGFDQKTCSEGRIRGWDACLFLDLKPTIGFRLDDLF